MGCLAETGFCRIEGCCVLRHALREATLAFLHTLDGYTLADLLAPGTRLVRSFLFVAFSSGVAAEGFARRFGGESGASASVQG